jgi:signal transduction histidine kinase
MSAPAKTPRGPTIRQLLLAVNAFVLLAPLIAALALRIYDTHLVQQTETRLISEAVLIGELYRADLLEAEHLPPGQTGRITPPDNDDRYAPIEPILDLGHGLAAREPPPTRNLVGAELAGPAFLAGAKLKAILDRAQLVNLSAVRVLDANGCTVASTGEEALLGTCLTDAPEVRTALNGSYGAVVRAYHNEERAPLGGHIRRGHLRVYSAVPVLSDSKVIGAVRVSRTSATPLEAVWIHRREFALAFLGCILLTLGLSVFLSRTITQPMQAITQAAQAIASGRPREPLRGGALVPLEARALSQALDTLTAQLTDRAQYIAEFAANTSHELKTPLTSIRGAAELMHDEEMPREQRLRFLANIESDVARLERLTTRMLHLARIQSAPETADRVELQPFFARLAERYPGALRIDCPAISLSMNPDHLESALRNLIENAIRHGLGKPVEITARSLSPLEAGRVRIDVRDHGPGISEGNRARLFTRFFTTERDRGGTGLGLAIVRAVAETRGGSVQCESSLEGTTFSLVV